MTAIDPHLQRLFDSTPASRRRHVIVPVLFEWDGDADVLRDFGFRVGITIGSIVAADMPLALLPHLDELGLRAIEYGHRCAPTLDASRVDIGADKLPPITGPHPGKGVIVGIVDTGIDYAHPSFQRAAADGRILYIWDQRYALEKPRTGFPRRFPEEKLPRGFVTDFQWGIEYEKAGIDKAVAAHIEAIRKGKKPRWLRCQDSPGAHGTHVAGIACGSGAPPARPGDPPAYVGVAPEADLIVVALDFVRGATPRQILEAVEYIRQRARKLKRPCVINLSLGGPLGARDGTSFFEKGIDAVLAGPPPPVPPPPSEPGRAIVIAAGNNANKAMHAFTKVAQGKTATLTLEVDRKDPAASLTVEIWYGWQDSTERIAAEVVSPKGRSTGSIGAGAPGRAVVVEDRNKVSINSVVGWSENKANRLQVHIARDAKKGGPQISPGPWQIRLTGTTIGGAAKSGETHAYLQRPGRVRQKVSDPKHAAFTGAMVSAASTMTIPGTATEAICVASYITKPAAGRGTLSAFSSQGPTLDAKARPPTIAAPGQLIRAARAANAQAGSGSFLDMQGTSMAAPHVSGVVAAMLQVNPTLKQKDIARLLRDTARKPSGPPDANKWGGGMLDAAKAVGTAKPAPLVEPEQAGVPTG